MSAMKSGAACFLKAHDVPLQTTLEQVVADSETAIVHVL